MITGNVTGKGRFVMPRFLVAMVLASVLVLAGYTASSAATVVLQWDPVTSAGLTGYKVYYQADSIAQPFQGTGASEGDSPLAVGTQTTCTITNLDPTKIWYFAVTALFASGEESAYSNIVSSAPDGQRMNVALVANGGVATASSTFSSSFPAAGVNNGDRRGVVWGGGGGWNDATGDAFPDWAQITFSGQQTISEIDVYTLQDNYASPVEPTATLTFTKYGITAFDVQYWNGSGWVTVPGGSITGNNLVWRKFTFAAVTTDRIRVMVNAALASCSRITEIEVY
jgi:hypothetical protein